MMPHGRRATLHEIANWQRLGGTCGTIMHNVFNLGGGRGALSQSSQFPGNTARPMIAIKRFTPFYAEPRSMPLRPLLGLMPLAALAIAGIGPALAQPDAPPVTGQAPTERGGRAGAGQARPPRLDARAGWRRADRGVRLVLHGRGGRVLAGHGLPCPAGARPRGAAADRCVEPALDHRDQPRQGRATPPRRWRSAWSATCWPSGPTS